MFHYLSLFSGCGPIASVREAGWGRGEGEVRRVAGLLSKVEESE